MEARIAALEQALGNRPTVSQTQEHVKIQLDLYMGTITELIGQRADGQGRFRTRDAKEHVPKHCSGDKDKISSVEFMASVKNWADVLHDKGVDIIEHVESSGTPIDERKIDEEQFPEARLFSRYLYMQLSDKLIGDPLKFVNKQKHGEGLAAWRELVNWYDSRNHEDKSAAFAKIVAPPKASEGHQPDHRHDEFVGTACFQL